MGQGIKAGFKSDLTHMCVWVLEEFFCALNSQADHIFGKIHSHIFFELFAEIERANIQLPGNGIQRNGIGVMFVQIFLGAFNEWQIGRAHV